MASLGKERELEAERWRNTFFHNPDGREVLEEMLEELEVFSSIAPDDTERMVLRNYGLSILYRLGVLQDMNIKEMIDNFASMPYKENIDGNT